MVKMSARAFWTYKITITVLIATLFNCFATLILQLDVTGWSYYLALAFLWILPNACIMAECIWSCVTNTPNRNDSYLLGLLFSLIRMYKNVHVDENPSKRYSFGDIVRQMIMGIFFFSVSGALICAAICAGKPPSRFSHLMPIIVCGVVVTVFITLLCLMAGFLCFKSAFFISKKKKCQEDLF